MNRRFLVVLVVCLALVGLMVSCKNDIEINEEFGQELVSVTFAEASGASRGLSASLEDFEHNIENYYWGYAAKKSAKDTSEMRRGETPNYATSVVWLNVQNSEPAPGLPSTPIPGFSQGYWDFRLCAYKKVNVGTPSDPVYDYVLVYQGETKEFLLKSSSTNESGNNLVTVTVNPVSIIGQNGTLIIKTTGTDAIKLNTVDETVYGENYFPRVISVATLEAYPVEYVNTEAEIKVASYVKDDEEKQVDGLFSLPAGSYKITFVFSDSASSPTVNYAKGTIVATVYSNLETTIKGDLSEMTTSVTIQPELNPELVTYTAVSDYIQPKADPTTSITFSSTGVARKVEAKTTAAVTNKIIENMATDSGTTTGYNQQLKLNLNVETVEATETTATYEIGMTATLTSTSTTVPTDVKTSTSDVSSVAKYVTVTLGIQEGLTEVAAYHDGNEMMNLQGFNLGEGWTVVASIVNDVVSVKKVKSGEADVDITNLLDDVLDPFDTLNRGFFFYDDSGVIVFITRSFSPYSLSFVKPLPADFVAEVGGFKYVKLENAIKKAETSSKVTLLKDIELESDVDFNVEGGILDLAGYTITGNVTASEKGAIIKNGSITGTLTASGNSALIKDFTVTGKISIGGTGAVLDNCAVVATGEYAINVTAGDATIKSGTYKAAENGKILKILNGSILVEDGNFKGSTLAVENAPVSLIGGVYEQNVGPYVADGYECAKVSEGVYKVRKIVEARNVTTETDYYFLQDAIDASSAGDVIEILININAEKTITVPAEKELTIRLGETTELQTFIPHTITTNAKLGLINDGSLTIDGTGSLISCYKVEGTYNDETNYPLTIKNNGSLILDGCIVGCEYGRVVDNYGTLTIKNNAELKANNLTENNGYGDFLIHSVHGTVIVNSMVINNTTTAKGIFQITDGSTLTVEDANIDIVCSCYLVDLRNGSNGKSTATIKKGTFKTTMKYYASGILSDCQQQMFTFKDKVSSVDGSVLTIDGGTFKFNNSYCYTQGSTNYCPEYVTFQNVSSTSNLSTLVVNGGTFESIGKKDSETLLPTHLYYNPSSGSINVILSVGTFDVSADSYEGGLYPAYVLAAGSKKVFENKKLVVSKITPEDDPVARIGDGADALYFMTLKDAFDYNNVYGNGDTLEEGSYEGLTIVVLRSADITEKIPVNKNAYLDLGSFTLTNRVAGDGRFKVYDSTLIIAGDKDNNGKIVMDNNNSGMGYVDLRNSSGSSTGNEKLIVRNVSFDGGVNIAGFFAYRHNGQSMDFDHVTVTTPSSPLCDIRSIINGYNQQVKLRVTNSSFTYYSSNTTNGVFQAGIYPQVYYTLEDSTDVFMENVTVKANYGPVLECHGTVTYSNCDFKVDAFTQEYFASAVCAALGGITTVNNTNYDSTYGAYVWSTGGTINIESGSFKGSNAVLFAQTDTGSFPLAKAIINVSDGTFDGSINAIGKAAIYISGGSFTKVSFSTQGVAEGADYGIFITGGTFDADPSDYVVAGYYARDNGNGTWTVEEITEDIAVAKLIKGSDTTLYMSLRSALTASTDESEVLLLKDIDLSDQSWEPVPGFEGTFDGDKHTITGLTISVASDADAAMFVDICAGATIKNLYLEDVNISGGYASGFVGFYAEAITLNNLRCMSGTISGSSYAAGIVGCPYGNSVIEDCFNAAKIEGWSASGIVSYLYTSRCSGCKNIGTITGRNRAGGIAADVGSSSVVEDCTNTGNVIVTGESSGMPAGGIVGNLSSSTVRYCVNTGSVSHNQVEHNDNNSAAGIVGHSSTDSKQPCTVEFCINTGAINSKGSYAAGIITQMYGGTSRYNYNSGTVTSEYATTITGASSAYGISSRAGSTPSSANNSLNAGSLSAPDGLVSQIADSETMSYYYDGDTLNADVDDALADLNSGLDEPFFWGIDLTDGKIKPLSLIETNN